MPCRTWNHRGDGRRRTVLPLWLIPAFLALAPAASAVDGVVEINQTAGLAGGVTPGDAPGLPVTISRSGSYRLTSNLITGGLNNSGIVVDADDVTIDMNGFAIVCLNLPLFCLPVLGTPTGVGVSAEFSADRTTLRNGTVWGMGSDGVILRSHSLVEGVTAVSNGRNGITLGEYARVDNCLATNNDKTGIRTDFYGRVTNSTSAGNDEEGIRVESSGLIRGNIVRDNGAEGIYAAGSLVEGNQVASNGGVGIRVPSGGSVIGNRVASNDEEGLALTNTGFVNNVMDNNAQLLNPADEVIGGISMGVNICDDAPCP